MCGWQAKLCDPSLTCAVPERLRGGVLIIKHYTNRHVTLLDTDWHLRSDIKAAVSTISTLVSYSTGMCVWVCVGAV